MAYTRLTVRCDVDFRDILTAELAEIGFDAFMETEDGFEAYADEERYDRNALEDLRERYAAITTIEFTFDTIEQRNWNEEWERSFDPIDVEGKCLIRAEFHAPSRQYPFEIIITPKMSFGTGHHQTTYLMVKNQMAVDHVDKRVMDAGCGTAVLSIVAAKLGAREILAFDIDEWSIVNATENVGVNGCSNISIQRGTIREVNPTGLFDIILANINKNILLDEMGEYARRMEKEGILMLSGFYMRDVPDLLSEAATHGLEEVGRDEKENWAALILRKSPGRPVAGHRL